MRIFCLIFLLLFSSTLIAQESFNYQANILTKEGLPAANRKFKVTIKVSNDSNFILNNYQEIVNTQSGNYGYITFEIGNNGNTYLSSAVQWNLDVYINLQITTTDNLEKIDIPIKHKLNYAPKAIYAVKAESSLVTDLAYHAINSDTSSFSKTGAWALKADSALHAINSDTAKYGASLFGIGKQPFYALDVKGFGRFVADETPTIGPELRFKGYRQEWVMGVDVANNGGSGDFVMLADQRSNGEVRDLIYVNRNKEGDNSINDDSGYPTIGFWATPAFSNVQSLFTVPNMKANRDIVGIRKSPYSINSKMLSFLGPEDTLADLWINDQFEAAPFWKVRGDLLILSDTATASNRLILNANPTDYSSNFKLRNIYYYGKYYFKIQDQSETKDFFSIDQTTGRVSIGNASFTEMLNVPGNINAIKIVADSLRMKNNSGFVFTNNTNQTIANFGVGNSTNVLFNGDVSVSGQLKTQGLNVITEADTSTLARKLISINTLSDNYVLNITDVNNMVIINSAIDKNIIVPLNSIIAFPVGSKITIMQNDIGQVTIVPEVGVTIKSADNKTKTRTQYAVVTLIKIDTNTWSLFGDL